MTRSADHDDMTLADKEQIDEAIRQAHAPRAGDALRRAILEDFDQIARERRKSKVGLSTLTAIFDRFRLASVGAFAGLSALGAFTGFITANANADLTPEEEFYQYAQVAFEFGGAEGGEGVFWDED